MYYKLQICPDTVNAEWESCHRKVVDKVVKIYESYFPLEKHLNGRINQVTKQRRGGHPNLT